MWGWIKRQVSKKAKVVHAVQEIVDVYEAWLKARDKESESGKSITLKEYKQLFEELEQAIQAVRRVL